MKHHTSFLCFESRLSPPNPQKATLSAASPARPNNYNMFSSYRLIQRLGSLSTMGLGCFRAGAPSGCRLLVPTVVPVAIGRRDWSCVERTAVYRLAEAALLMIAARCIVRWWWLSSRCVETRRRHFSHHCTLQIETRVARR